MDRPLFAVRKRRLAKPLTADGPTSSDSSAAVPRSSFLNVDGIDLHWAELGSGPPLLLLHGLCDSHRTWLLVAPTLARGRRVLMLDLAGHGESARPDASYALEWHADLVAAWLAALGIAQADVVGHSYGGGVAQWMLLKHRPLVRRLALESSGGLGREVGTSLRWASLPFVVERFGQPFMSFGTTRALNNAAAGAFSDREIALLASYNARPGTARAFSRSVRDVIDHRGQHRHFLDRAGEVASLPPIALFWGEEDPLIPIEHGIRAAAHLDGVTLTRFPGVAHFPHRQVPARFAGSLEQFLSVSDLPAARLHRQGWLTQKSGRHAPSEHVQAKSGVAASSASFWRVASRAARNLLSV